MPNCVVTWNMSEYSPATLRTIVSPHHWASFEPTVYLSLNIFFLSAFVRMNRTLYKSQELRCDAIKLFISGVLCVFSMNLETETPTSTFTSSFPLRQRAPPKWVHGVWINLNCFYFGFPNVFLSVSLCRARFSAAGRRCEPHVACKLFRRF